MSSGGISHPHCVLLVNSWRSVHEVSPYRVTYGIRNPALRGLILTSDSIVPDRCAHKLARTVNSIFPGRPG